MGLLTFLIWAVMWILGLFVIFLATNLISRFFIHVIYKKRGRYCTCGGLLELTRLISPEEAEARCIKCGNTVIRKKKRKYW
jgi:hypothetical protein